MHPPTDVSWLSAVFAKSVRDHWMLFLDEGIVLLVLAG
jgi:hypothetical protein